MGRPSLWLQHVEKRSFHSTLPSLQPNIQLSIEQDVKQLQHTFNQHNIPFSQQQQANITAVLLHAAALNHSILANLPLAPLIHRLLPQLNNDVQNTTGLLQLIQRQLDKFITDCNQTNTKQQQITASANTPITAKHNANSTTTAAELQFTQSTGFKHEVLLFAQMLSVHRPQLISHFNQYGFDVTDLYTLLALWCQNCYSCVVFPVLFSDCTVDLLVSFTSSVDQSKQHLLLLSPCFGLFSQMTDIIIKEGHAADNLFSLLCQLPCRLDNQSTIEACFEMGVSFYISNQSLMKERRANCDWYNCMLQHGVIQFSQYVGDSRHFESKSSITVKNNKSPNTNRASQIRNQSPKLVSASLLKQNQPPIHVNPLSPSVNSPPFYSFGSAQDQTIRLTPQQQQQILTPKSSNDEQLNNASFTTLSQKVNLGQSAPNSPNPNPRQAALEPTIRITSLIKAQQSANSNNRVSAAGQTVQQQQLVHTENNKDKGKSSVSSQSNRSANCSTTPSTTMSMPAAASSNESSPSTGLTMALCPQDLELTPLPTLKYQDFQRLQLYPCIHHEGWLLKARKPSAYLPFKRSNTTGLFGAFHRRYFVLQGHFLSYFKSAESRQPSKGESLDLRWCRVQATSRSEEGEFGVEIALKDNLHLLLELIAIQQNLTAIQQITPAEEAALKARVSMLLFATSAIEQQVWMKLLQQGTELSSLLQVQAERTDSG